MSYIEPIGKMECLPSKSPISSDIMSANSYLITEEWRQLKDDHMAYTMSRSTKTVWPIFIVSIIFALFIFAFIIESKTFNHVFFNSAFGSTHAHHWETTKIVIEFFLVFCLITLSLTYVIFDHKINQKIKKDYVPRLLEGQISMLTAQIIELSREAQKSELRKLILDAVKRLNASLHSIGISDSLHVIRVKDEKLSISKESDILKSESINLLKYSIEKCLAEKGGMSDKEKTEICLEMLGNKRIF